MPKVHCYTSATFSYLDRVRVLAQSVKKHHPDWEFSLCLCDKPPPGTSFDIGEEPIDHLIDILDLDIENIQSWIFRHNIVELCTAVKGIVLERLLQTDCEYVVYLDPDIAIFDALTEVEESIRNHSVILTPHQLTPEPSHDIQAIIDNEIGSLKYGIYNLGFITVVNDAEGRRFASWWKNRLLSFCFDDLANGLFTDQKWCNHIPSFFNRVCILKHPGYNVASWNLSQRLVTIDAGGDILINTCRLKFFHFTKVNWIGEVMLERYCRDRIEIFELMLWYRRELRANAFVGLPNIWWHYGSFSDGKPVLQKHRDKYRSDSYLNSKSMNPYDHSDLFWGSDLDLT